MASAIILGILAVGMLCYGVFLVYLLVSIWFGAPYVPSSPERLRAMIELAELRPGERAIDLGSGDGRILRAAARAGATVVGWEMNPALVIASRIASAACGQGVRTTIIHGSFWDARLGEFDVIFAYLLPETMERLQGKIRREARPGARIVSNAFSIPGWPLDAERGRVYRYRVPSSARSV